MRQIIFALLVLLSFSLFHLEAQDAQPLIQLNDFSTRGISSEEALLIQTLFLSYLSEMGEIITPMGSHIEQVSVIPPSPHDNSMSRSVDYTINGVIRLEQDGHIFLLEITNNRSGETCSVNSMYKTTGELALKARSILEAVFSEVMESEKQNAISPEIIHENRIIGTWKGEAGIEMINLQRGGQGVAFFSSGAQMVLSYDIIDNILRVRQVSPNSERFYYPLPLYAAIHLAAGAEPMVWELTLYKKGAVLSGVRQATAVRMDFERVGELVHRGDIRHVQWTRVLY